MLRVVVIVVAVPILLAGASEDRGPAQYQGEGFTCLLPHGVGVVRRTPANDFVLYDFKYKGKLLLGAYVGNHPDVGAEFLKEDRDSKRQAKEKGYSIRSVTRKTIGGAASREVLFIFSFRGDWNDCLHFWYRGLSADMAKVADAIITSTEPAVEEGDLKRVVP